MVFGAGKGEGGYNKVKIGDKNSEGSKRGSDGGAASLHNDADAPSELCLGVLTLVKQGTFA